jgi:two-component system chemotaxis response regulator CheB
VLVAQHLAPGFIDGLARWLSECSALEVSVVADQHVLEPGRVYLPADGHHLELDGRLVRSIAPVDDATVPSVDRLFKSCLGFGPGVVAVLLTGMGEDGAKGMLELRRQGQHTIVQDEATSLVHGMPRVAAELGAAVEELALEAIAPRLLALAVPGAPR